MNTPDKCPNCQYPSLGHAYCPECLLPRDLWPAVQALKDEIRLNHQKITRIEEENARLKDERDAALEFVQGLDGLCKVFPSEVLEDADIGREPSYVRLGTYIGRWIVRYEAALKRVAELENWEASLKADFVRVFNLKCSDWGDILSMIAEENARLKAENLRLRKCAECGLTGGETCSGLVERSGIRQWVATESSPSTIKAQVLSNCIIVTHRNSSTSDRS